jgi:hypothetical protein
MSSRSRGHLEALTVLPLAAGPIVGLPIHSTVSPRLIDGAWGRKSLAAKFHFQGCCLRGEQRTWISNGPWGLTSTFEPVRMGKEQLVAGRQTSKSGFFVTPALAPGVRACATDPATPSAGRRDASGQSRAVELPATCVRAGRFRGVGGARLPWSNLAGCATPLERPRGHGADVEDDGVKRAQPPASCW